VTRPTAPEIIWLNGRFLEPGERATVDLRDRAYLHGDSVFATARAVSGRVFLVERQIARLREAAEAFGIAWPEVDLAEVMAVATERVGADDVTLRVTLGRGAGPWGVGLGSPPGSAGRDKGLFEPSASVVARVTAPYPAEAYERGIDTRIVATRRIPSACLPARHKTGSYLGTILARRELSPPSAPLSAALVEGIQLSVGGHVSSGTISNLFAVMGGRLVTPPLTDDCRPGLTRELIFELAPRAGVEVVEESLLPADLGRAQEVFFTSTLMDCLPVRSIEGGGAYTRFDTAAKLRSLLSAARGEQEVLEDAPAER